MGRQRAPPERCWKRPLRAGGCWLLWLCGTALRALRGLWSLTWVTEEVKPQWGRPGTRPAGGHGGAPHTGLVPGTVWAQLPMDLRVPSVRVGFQLGTALQLRLGRSEEEEEEEADSDSAWQPGQTGQRRGDASEAMLGRLEALEADVRFLCTELGAEKLLWSSRFLELLREQQSLRQRVSARGGPAPKPPVAAPTLTACSSCRSCRGTGTVGTAPSCWGRQRSKVPVGVRERAQKDASGWRHLGNHVAPSSLVAEKASEGVNKASAVQEGSTHSSCPGPSGPRPGCCCPSCITPPQPNAAELQPFPRSRNQLEAGQDKPLSLGLPQDTSQPSLPRAAPGFLCPTGAGSDEAHRGASPCSAACRDVPGTRSLVSTGFIILHWGDRLQNSPTDFLTGHIHPLMSCSCTCRNPGQLLETVAKGKQLPRHG
ncbi:PREDICTED: uncharacterized protein LOC101807988 [Ficedula albicollis]|uniref:uncharacterized protein LOC101807988 n=1 Tax=Ficedula albicollis TaxID=59894 RepID=UPI000359E455|nr:PREDICTED: uncharacterized protein LOC101807988 [Ficedula albicollis]